VKVLHQHHTCSTKSAKWLVRGAISVPQDSLIWQGPLRGYINRLRYSDEVMRLATPAVVRQGCAGPGQKFFALNGPGQLRTTSASPSITLAFAPASRCASISLISSIPRSRLLIAHRLNAAGMLDLHFARHEQGAYLHVGSELRFPHFFNGLTSVQAEVIGQRADKVGAERPTRPFQGPASISRHPFQPMSPGVAPWACW